MSEIIVRVAEAGEFDAVGALTVVAYVDGGFVAPESSYVAELADARARSEATLLVAVDNGDQILGTVTFCRHGEGMAEMARLSEAEIRMLAVAKAARGRGAGQALTDACLNLAREHRDRGVILSTMPSMRAAHRMYERLGFSRVAERDWQPAPGLELLAYYRAI
jgi:ribosomal protein S18 acetylase RimI-like enzyme